MTNPKRLENYVIMKRDLRSDYLSRKINRDELSLIFWIRLSANPYGLATVNIEMFVQDLFQSRKNVNQVTKMMLNLKRQRYLYYKTRGGSRGSFEVHLPDFILPNARGVTSIDKFYEDVKSRGIGAVEDEFVSELSQSLDDEKQRSDDIKDDIKSMLLNHSVKDESRAHNNDNDKDIENDKNHLPHTKKKRNTNTQSFQPETLEEMGCKNIALNIGETDISYLLSILDRYGYIVLESAIEEFSERQTEGVENLRAYFNSIVELKLVEFGYKTNLSQKI